METYAESTPIQERDSVRIKLTHGRRSIKATVGGVVYVLMDGAHKSEFFAAFVEKDAYYIELIPTADKQML